MVLADYTFQFNSGVVLNSDGLLPFVDVTRVSGLDSAPYRETVRDHEGVDGGFIDAEFEQGRDIVVEGTAYCDSSNAETYFDSLKANYAPVTSPLPFVFKAPGVSERVVFVKPRGARYDWDTARRYGASPIQLLMYAEDPRIYDNSLINTVVPYGGAATTGFGFVNVIATFGTNVVDGWPNADTGEAWTLSGGTVPGDYDSAGGVGTHTVGAVNASRWSTLASQPADFHVVTSVTTGVTPLGGSHYAALAGRFADTNNNYLARLDFPISGNIFLTLRKRVAGVETQLASFDLGITYTPGTMYRMEFKMDGSLLRAKAWALGSAYASDWQITATDTDITAAGAVGVRSILSSANTNTLPVIYSYDNFEIYKGFAFTFSFGSVVPPTGAFITNGGNRPTPALLTIQGPVTDPRIINETDGKTLRFVIDLGASDTLVVDLANHTVTFDGVVNRRDTLQEPNWFLFNPGNTFIRFGGAAGSGTLTVSYRNAWR